MTRHWTTSLLFLFSMTAATVGQQGLGYYRQPAISKDTLVFVAEGDLWKAPLAGGKASRLTTHASDEQMPAISPDGKSVAFVGSYEGPSEVYVMPLTGGAPKRLTWDGARISFVGWTPSGDVMFSTDADATKPAQQLVVMDTAGKRRARVPLAQAADGCYSDVQTLYFTRLPFQGSHTKRYKGGTAQNIWTFRDGNEEAKPLTANYTGTSKNPMFWRERIYFLTDRDGTMNVWSMNPEGINLIQHTKHKGWDAAGASLADGKIAYQLGADIHIYDIVADKDQKIPLQLDSDYDQTRERWIKSPVDYLSAAHISNDGSKVALTARGRVFAAPAKTGRFVEATRMDGVRYRDARFFPDGKSMLVLSDESGEVELWKLNPTGNGVGERLTTDGDVLRWDAVISPDGKFIAHHDKNQRLFVYDVEAKRNLKFDETKIDEFEGLTWSPDSKWLAYVVPGENLFRRIRVYNVADKKGEFVTTDRYDSYSPAWSPDGKWLYFLSDRNLQTMVPSPWGTYQPEPFLSRKTRIYQIALVDGLRSPFTPPDELQDEKKEPAKKDEKKDEKKDGDKKDSGKKEPDKKEPEKKAALVRIDFDGITSRLFEVPLPAGNYRDLTVNDKALFYVSSPVGEIGNNLMGVAIGHENNDAKQVVAGVRMYEMSGDGKKLLIRKGDTLSVIDANAAPADLAKKDVDLSNWSLSIVPREEWRQMFAEAWRLERDYFYDRGMHGVDWPAVRKKYEPLVDRVSSRTELSDLIAQMVSELSALHIFVRDADARKGDDNIAVSNLGARLVRDENAGGYRVEHIYKSDPDEPNLTSPLAKPDVKVKVGDIITMVNGTGTLTVPDIGQLLRRKAGQQVLLSVKTGQDGKSRDVIVKPIATSAASDLRYHEWEYTRRLEVESQSNSQIGYVHLRAMGGGNFTEFAKNFYPVFTRQGLIIDVRHNRGGNIDSWIISRLMRKAWFYWNQRVGQKPLWNMQYAFRGHIVVLCDEWTASDGEAFCEGIKRLKLGTVIGARTWGGEIWLSANNFLVDRGIATSAEFGVYGPEGAWLIEGHGVDPDIVVDNLPHATFKGKDAQLEAAIKYLQKQIKEMPIETPPPPKGPVLGGRP